jgi:hypothetical protein
LLKMARMAEILKISKICQQIQTQHPNYVSSSYKDSL